MQHRILAVALALCLVLPAISGCSLLPGASDDSADTPTVETPSTPSTETAGGDSMERITVPNVLDLSASDAQRLLRDVGLEPMFRFRHDDAERMSVINQSFIEH